ncbi:terminase small subunit [Oxalobacter aliiformigenes]|uniref:terminase small subunit n=1 Tax=Oxalobacter aliiformigenes TaxID=2946593 RepID=UPI0022AF4F9D|nr:terminase small subunit [Oxalobacter aliiformigenes]MCZ4064949.1 terminase small subunit [Oxalobacter aliiformigenes]WAW00151.1 terminase small subunit [Oxalobacter aliiformigenes]
MEGEKTLNRDGRDIQGMAEKGEDGASLTARQRRFVDEYLVDLNATQATVRAGYAPSGARQHASRLLARENVKKAVADAMKRRQERVELTADEVIGDLRELRDICMGRKPVKIMTIVKNAREGTAEPVEVEGMMFEPAAAQPGAGNAGPAYAPVCRQDGRDVERSVSAIGRFAGSGGHVGRRMDGKCPTAKMNACPDIGRQWTEVFTHGKGEGRKSRFAGFPQTMKGI